MGVRGENSQKACRPTPSTIVGIRNRQANTLAAAVALADDAELTI